MNILYLDMETVCTLKLNWRVNKFKGMYGYIVSIQRGWVVRSEGFFRKQFSLLRGTQESTHIRDTDYFSLSHGRRLMNSVVCILHFALHGATWQIPCIFPVLWCPSNEPGGIDEEITIFSYFHLESTSKLDILQRSPFPNAYVFWPLLRQCFLVE